MHLSGVCQRDNSDPQGITQQHQQNQSIAQSTPGGRGYPGRPGGRRTGSPMRCLPPQGSQSAAAGIQRDAMIFFDEDDLNCWIVLALLSILMALPLH